MLCGLYPQRLTNLNGTIAETLIHQHYSSKYTHARQGGSISWCLIVWDKSWQQCNVYPISLYSSCWEDYKFGNNDFALTEGEKAIPWKLLSIFFSSYYGCVKAWLQRRSVGHYENAAVNQAYLWLDKDKLSCMSDSVLRVCLRKSLWFDHARTHSSRELWWLCSMQFAT